MTRQRVFAALAAAAMAIAVYAAPAAAGGTEEVPGDAPVRARLADTDALRMPTPAEVDAVVTTLTTMGQQPADSLPSTPAPPVGAVALDLAGGFSGMVLARPNGGTARGKHGACSRSKRAPSSSASSRRSSEDCRHIIRKTRRRVPLGHARRRPASSPSPPPWPAAGPAQFVIVNLNGPGVGFNDATPAAPVGGNPGTTLGEQRLIAFEFAAASGARVSTSGCRPIRCAFTPLAAGVLGSAGPMTSSATSPFARLAGHLVQRRAGEQARRRRLLASPFDLNAKFSKQLQLLPRARQQPRARRTTSSPCCCTSSLTASASARPRASTTGALSGLPRSLQQQAARHDARASTGRK